MRGGIAVGAPDLENVVGFLVAWPTSGKISERIKVYLQKKYVQF